MIAYGDTVAPSLLKLLRISKIIRASCECTWNTSHSLCEHILPSFPSIFYTEFFLFLVFAIFLSIDDALHVEVAVVGGRILSSVQTSCRVRHTLLSTFDFVRFDVDNASKNLSSIPCSPLHIYYSYLKITIGSKKYVKIPLCATMWESPWDENPQPQTQCYNIM